MVRGIVVPTYEGTVFIHITLIEDTPHLPGKQTQVVISSRNPAPFLNPEQMLLSFLTCF